jgi:outer membrane lipoprotein SlyB
LFRPIAAVVALCLALNGCGPNYSPDTYATNAAQQANKVEPGTIAGVRPVHFSAAGTVGGVAGAAAGGVAGSQVGTGSASAFAAIGGSLLGGLAGVATEHVIGDTNGFEYIVRKANGDMISVAQKDEKPLWVGEKVLVIAGPQARIVPDYTVPFDNPAKPPAKTATQTPAAPAQAPPASPAPDGVASPPPHPVEAPPHLVEAPPYPIEAPARSVEAPPVTPPATVAPVQVPSAFGSPAVPPPAIATPP